MFARERWRALGTTAELLVFGEQARLDHAREQARQALEQVLAEIDLACSRFRADSELCKLNAAGGRRVEVSPLLFQAVELALRAARVTDGDVDPTLGVALERAGYDCDWGLLTGEKTDRAAALTGKEHGSLGRSASPPVRVTPFARTREPAHDDSIPPKPPAPDGVPRVLARVRASRHARWRAIRVDRARATIALAPGVKLDLGATAKAWAADRGAAAAAAAASGCGVLVNLGGDIATAGPSPQDGWRVHVTDDHRDSHDAPGQTLTIAGGGLATSSTTVRRWLLADGGASRVPRTGHRSPVGGETMHHIIDPATGVPANSPWRTVSVAASSCADANIAATAAIVRGDSALRWLAELGLPARLVGHDGDVVAVAGWPCERRHEWESSIQPRTAAA